MLLLITFSTTQMGLSQEEVRTCLAATSFFNNLRNAAGKVTNPTLEILTNEAERTVFPFLSGTIADILATERFLKEITPREKVIAQITELFGSRCKADYMARFDLQGLTRDNNSILIPLADGTEAYRFFYAGDKDLFASDTVVTSFDDIVITERASGSEKKETISVRKIALKAQELPSLDVNIASGTWTSDQHDRLNDMIGTLINTSADNTVKYNDADIKKGVKTAFENFSKTIPPYLKAEIERALIKIDPKLTLSSYLGQMAKLLANPRFKMFFLVPANGEDQFKFLYKKDGKAVLLAATAHFGHHKTRGAQAEQNVYIASPYYDGLGFSEKIGVVSHEMAHLLLGSGNDIHFLADLTRSAMSYSYDFRSILSSRKNVSEKTTTLSSRASQTRTESGADETRDLTQDIDQYLTLKDKILEYTIKGEREKALTSYKEMKTLIAKIGRSDISESTLTAVIDGYMAERLVKALARIIPLLDLTGGNLTLKSNLVMNICDEEKVSPILSTMIWDSIKDVSGTYFAPEFFATQVLLRISADLAAEIRRISRTELPGFMKDMVDDVIKEVTESMYDDDAARKHWAGKLKKDIVPMSIENMLPEEYFSDEHFDKKKETIIGNVRNLNYLYLNVFGMDDPELKKVLLRPNQNRMATRTVLVHEIVHYMADAGEIKIDPSYEFITYALDVCTKIIHTHAGDIKKAEENFDICQTERYILGAKELYARGREISKNGESAYILKPHENEAKAGYFSIDLLVIEAVKIYDKLGIPSLPLRRYLNNKNKKLTQSFEAEELARDKYFAQEAAGIVMAGILIDEYEKTKKHPIRLIVDYFAELDNITGPPAASDVEWINTDFIPLLETLGQQIFGSKVKLEESDVTDRLGLWTCDIESRYRATVKYWPFTLYPGDKANADRTKAREAAKDRAIGNLFLALYRADNSKDGVVEKAHPEWFAKKEFDVLWEALLIPRSIY
ncbi:MAG: hypothetical protein HQL28_07010, partial [Candidatus Omnitrophica bacterium]|nr:hypothetical protein [Candidatus Omnitrophota bacterium]